MGLKRWLGYATDDLISPLPIGECVERLRAAVIEDGGPTLGKEGVIGAVGDNSLRLRKALRAGMHNSFQTYLRAELAGEGRTTRLTCRFGPHPFVPVFMLFWLALALAIGIAFLSFNLQVKGGGELPMPVRFMPFLMLPMGMAVVAVGRHFARNERPFLLDFLRQTIDARPVPTSHSARVSPVVQR